MLSALSKTAPFGRSSGFDMIIKAITLFLIAMGVLAMFGKLRAPKIDNPFKRDKTLSATKCKKCGSYILCKGPCACEKPD